MPWVRIDEHAMSHPKISALSDGAFRLWVQALAHCQNFLTDGIVVTVALKGMAAYAPKRRAELIACGLWLEGESGGIVVHDYLQWNDSRQEVLASREHGKERKRRWRESKNASRDAGQDAGRTRSSLVRGVREESPDAAIQGKGVQGETSPPKVAHDGPRLRVWQWMHDDLARRLGGKVDAFDLLGWYGRLEDELARTGEGFADPWRWLQGRLYRDADLPAPNLFGRERKPAGAGPTGAIAPEKRGQYDALTRRAGGPQ